MKTTLEDHVGEMAEKKSTQAKATAAMFGKSFRVDSEPLPQRIKDGILESMTNAKNEIKKAGTLSNQRSTAASAWLLNNERTHFQSATMAWTGEVSV